MLNSLQEVKRVPGRLIRLIAAVAVAGLVTLIVGLALTLGSESEQFVAPWQLALSSCIVWLMLANVVGRRGSVATTILGIFAVILTVAIAITVRCGIEWVSAKEGGTASQFIELLTLMLTMQLASAILFSGWATVPAGIFTAFMVRRIMKPGVRSQVRR